MEKSSTVFQSQSQDTVPFVQRALLSDTAQFGGTRLLESRKWIISLVPKTGNWGFTVCIFIFYSTTYIYIYVQFHTCILVALFISSTSLPTKGVKTKMIWDVVLFFICSLFNTV